MLLTCIIADTGALEKYDDTINAPFRDVLTVNSLELEKQITAEMLGVALSVDPVYHDDSSLLRLLRQFQTRYKIPPYDYQFCMAGPMTLGLLIEKFINSSVKTASFHRELYMRSDPVEKPGRVNLRGNDVVEFQVMYNTWAAEHGNPALVVTGNTDYSGQLEVDGYFGWYSRAAAINFQKSEPLLERKDGIVDAKTWKLLYVRTYLSRDKIVKQLLQWSNTYLP